MAGYKPKPFTGFFFFVSSVGGKGVVAAVVAIGDVGDDIAFFGELVTLWTEDSVVEMTDDCDEISELFR